MLRGYSYQLLYMCANVHDMVVTRCVEGFSIHFLQYHSSVFYTGTAVRKQHHKTVRHIALNGDVNQVNS